MATSNIPTTLFASTSCLQFFFLLVKETVQRWIHVNKLNVYTNNMFIELCSMLHLLHVDDITWNDFLSWRLLQQHHSQIGEVNAIKFIWLEFICIIAKTSIYLTVGWSSTIHEVLYVVIMFSILLFHEISMTWWITLFYSITFNCSNVLKRFVSLKTMFYFFFLRKEEWKCGSLSVVINDFIVNHKIVTYWKFPIYFNGQWGRTGCSLSLLWNTKTGTDQDQICSFNIVSS